MKRLIRFAAWSLIVAGVALGTWTATVWLWQDPVTSVYAAHRQSQLRSDLRATAKEFIAKRPEATEPRRGAPSAASLRRLAATYAASTPAGEALGRLSIPRLGLKVTFVNGTHADDLRAGPGRDERTGLPGQGRLVYIAGHRTTFGAPFANIDRLRPGDAISIELPYADFVYRVTGTRIVDARDLSVLKPGSREIIVLQACHPRFFATQRLLVYADQARVTAPSLRF